MIRVPAGTKLVIIDLDDTLARIPIDWQGMKRALAEAFPDASFAYLSRGLREVNSRHGQLGMTECFDVIRRFERNGVPGMQPVQEVLEMVQTNRKKLLFAICSNNMHSTIEDVVHTLGFEGVFSALVGRDDVVESKPAPEGLLKILATLQVAAEEALFVGNHADDEQAGEAAGIRTIVITPC